MRGRRASINRHAARRRRGRARRWATGPLDRAAVRAALERLQAALGDFELSAANDALADLAALGVPAEAAADLTRLRDRMDSYDYDEAQVIVARIVEHLERTTPP